MTNHKIRAYAKLDDGRKVLVLPRRGSRNTALFGTWKAAENALDKFGRKLGRDAQGIMESAITGEVRTMAI